MSKSIFCIAINLKGVRFIEQANSDYWNG